MNNLSLDDKLAKNVANSVKKCLSTAFNLSVNPQPWSLVSSNIIGDYSGNINFIDCKQKICSASMSIIFSEPAAQHILRKVYGDEVNKITRQVKELIRDGVSEIANIIFNNLKSTLNAEGYNFVLLLPFTIDGKDHIIPRKNNITSLRIPFLVDNYQFSVDVVVDATEKNMRPEEVKEFERIISGSQGNF